MAGIDLRKSLEYCTAPDLKQARNCEFQSLPADNLGYRRETIWLRLRTSAVRPVQWLLENDFALNDEVTLYQNGQTESIGDRIPFPDRKVSYRHPVFRITTPAGESELLLSVRSQGAVQVRFRAWSDEEFRIHESRQNSFYSLYLGALLIMVAYNLFLYGFIRDRLFLYYVLYLLTFIFFELGISGYGFAILWPEFPAWTNYVIPMSMFAGLSAIQLFAVNFMEIWSVSARLSRFLQIPSVTGFVFALGCLAIP